MKSKIDTHDCPKCKTLEKEIVSLKEALNEVKLHAYHDVLTGLPNRRLFVDQLENRIVRCQRYGDVCAILFLDVDNLKTTNDQFGHAAGDSLLTRLGEILNSNIRSTDLAARIGGDEYALLVDNLDADQVENKIAFLIDRVKNAHFKYEDIQMPFSVSIGYCFVGPTDTVEGLMSRADAAMYEAKGCISYK